MPLSLFTCIKKEFRNIFLTKMKKIESSSENIWTPLNEVENNCSDIKFCTSIFLHIVLFQHLRTYKLESKNVW